MLISHSIYCNAVVRVMIIISFALWFSGGSVAHMDTQILKGRSMLILKTSAQQVYWLGRYMARIEYLCEHFPFYSNETARRYAQAFDLQAQNAESLNELCIDQQHGTFKSLYNKAKNNIYHLNGVLTADAYSQLDQLLDRAMHMPMPCIRLSGIYMQILENEPLHGLYVFYQLGMALEHLDADMRLQQSYHDLAEQMQSYLTIIADLGHPQIEHSLIEIRDHIQQQNFSKLSEQINQILALERYQHE